MSTLSHIGKSYPTGSADEYFYDLGHQMLVDQGNYSIYSLNTYPVLDEYVWLGGSPVALIRSKLTSTWARQADGTGVCTRNNNEFGMCNIYFPVTDVVGKPVLMLNRAGQIAGTGDYDPFGHVSRVFIDAETSHPYGTTNGVFATLTQPVPSGFELRIQVRIDLLDLDWQDSDPAICVNHPRVWDLLELRDVSGTVLGSFGGEGSFVSGWGSNLPGGTLQLAIRNPGTCSFTPDATGNCTATCDGIVRPRFKSGVVVGSYEYRLSEAQAGPFWTPLRFPRQYYDKESDLFENWNRYYDPAIGRYLQSEPLLGEASFAKMSAEDGLDVPAYAYASNDPIIFYDDNGLHDTNGCQYGSTCSDCAEEARKIQAPDIRQCVVAKCKGKRVKLRCEEKRKKEDECGPVDPANPNGPRRSAAVRPGEKNRVTWCEDKLTPKCQALLLVHELAHLCNWLDEENPPPGVPKKALMNCRVQP